MQARTTHAEDLATIGFSLWTVIGLFVDAYNHVTNPELESFWTPWHAIFYSGFLASAIWLGVLRLRRRPLSEGDIFWAPQGYRPAMYGVALFALGGIGDAIWHEVFGVETSLDALLSPTHLLLFLGGLMIVAAPLRARWLDPEPDRSPSYPNLFPALMSLTFTTTLVAFFFEYAWALGLPWRVERIYLPGGGAEEPAAFGVLTILATTVILFPPILVAARRWRLPPGSATTYLLIVHLLIIVGFDQEATGVPAVAAAALAMELLIVREASSRTLATVSPLVLWSAYFLFVDLDRDLGWPPELWGGSILFAVLAMYAFDRLLDLAVDSFARTRESVPTSATWRR